MKVLSFQHPTKFYTFEEDEDGFLTKKLNHYIDVCVALDLDLPFV
ncbi:hypothetical protein [Natribacillus halophilus]|nr:hypothetical protein [Natribacillus halophilus]